MKIRSIVSLAALPLTGAVLFAGNDAATAAHIIAPPPNGDVSFVPQLVAPSGVNVVVTNAPLAGFSGTCAGPNLPLCSFFDFQPPAGGGIGNVAVTGSNPVGGPFSQFLTGSVGTIKDLQIPYLGVPPVDSIAIGATPVPFPVTALLDLTPGGIDDTFDADTLIGIKLLNTGAPLGSTSTAEFIFGGKWNVCIDPVACGSGFKQYDGTVILTAQFTQSIESIDAAARTPGGFTTSYSGTANIVAGVPEPSALAGLAVVAGSLVLTRKLKK